MLKVDLTTAKNPDAEALRKKYGVLGMPTLVFLRPDLSEIDNLRITRFEPANVFLPKMEAAINDTFKDEIARGWTIRAFRVHALISRRFGLRKEEIRPLLPILRLKRTRRGYRRIIQEETP